MPLKIGLTFLTTTILFLSSCNPANEKNKTTDIEPEKIKKSTFAVDENFLSKHSDSCKCSAEFELKDSTKLVHIKDQFYRSKTGHLYERTIGQKEVNGHLTDSEYFNGSFSQEVDPMTFKPLEGWYAKDINHVYYYRPLSSGMQISKIDSADSKTFKILEGHYKYAMDKKNFYDDMQIIEGFVPGKTKLNLDNKRRVIGMTYNNKSYKFQLVN